MKLETLQQGNPLRFWSRYKWVSLVLCTQYKWLFDLTIEQAIKVFLLLTPRHTGSFQERSELW